MSLNLGIVGLQASGKTTLRAIRGVCIARRLRARYKDAIPKGTKY